MKSGFIVLIVLSQVMNVSILRWEYPISEHWKYGIKYTGIQLSIQWVDRGVRYQDLPY